MELVDQFTLTRRFLNNNLRIASNSQGSPGITIIQGALIVASALLVQVIGKLAKKLYSILGLIFQENGQNQNSDRSATIRPDFEIV